jgi:hypothetical protein
VFFLSLWYAVASGTIASVNKPLLRVELCALKSSSEVEEFFTRKPMQASIADITRGQLDTLISATGANEQVCLLLR